MNRLVLTWPDDLAQAVRLTPDELAAQVRLMAALKMFELGKLSSGKELTRPSDDPAAVGKALLLRSSVEGTKQHQRKTQRD